jgi:serine/threonine protein kinase
MGTPSVADQGGLLPSGVRPLRPGDPTELGGHTLVGRLGSGGMGVVYLGRDPLGGLVAVKSAHRETADEELTRRFAAEADCLRRVPEGCTARLIKDGTTRTPPYLITEYVEGRSLANVVDIGGPLPPEQVHALATGVLRALAAVHRAGLVHRDLKPPNIVLTVSGPRLIDFGIAQKIGASGGPTGPETVMGSPGWISPERLNRQPGTPASDVFGWGCVAAYAATGRNPFGQGDAEELARRILTEPPDLDGVEEPLRALVAEALSKDPEARPSAEELLERLSGHGGVVALRTTADPEATSRATAATAADPAEADSEPDSGTDSGSDSPSVEPVAAASPVRRRRRRPAFVGVVVAAAAVLTAFVVTHDADHDVARTPPSGATPASPPHGKATVRASHRAPALRARSGEPRARPSTSSERPPSARPSPPSQPLPVTVPSVIEPSVPTVLKTGKGRDHGGGDGPSGSPSGGLLDGVG